MSREVDVKLLEKVCDRDHGVGPEREAVLPPGTSASAAAHWASPDAALQIAAKRENQDDGADADSPPFWSGGAEVTIAEIAQSWDDKFPIVESVVDAGRVNVDSGMTPL